MARHGLWLNVGMILGGLALSSAMVRLCCCGLSTRLAVEEVWSCDLACGESADTATRCDPQVTVYWLSHYPSSVADVAVGDWRSPEVVAQDGKARATAIVHKLQGNKGKGTSASVFLVF
jgi:hypothetical protein